MSQKTKKSSEEIICPNCRVNSSTLHPYLGVLPCNNCTQKQRQLPQAFRQVEFTSESIRHQRREFNKDITQMHYKGELSKEWLEIHGADKAHQHGFSDKEIKAARYNQPDRYYSS